VLDIDLLFILPEFVDRLSVNWYEQIIMRIHICYSWRHMDTLWYIHLIFTWRLLT